MENEEIRKYQRLLILYFRENHPEKLLFNPRVIEVTETHIKFGLLKHMGRMRISKRTLNTNYNQYKELKIKSINLKNV